MLASTGPTTFFGDHALRSAAANVNICALIALAWSLGQAASPPSPNAADAAPVEDYEVGPSDILKISVFGHEDLAQVVVVQTDGTLSYPFIGSVRASGLTTKELEHEIATALGRAYIRNPQVTVVVQEYRSKQVYVVGEINRPGVYPISGKMTVVEILSRAGPLGANAGSEVLIVRPEGAASAPTLPDEVGGPAAARRATVLRVNVQDIQAGNLDRNLALKPGDTVFIPLAPRIYVSGEVRNSGSYAFSAGMTVRQALSLAGGFTPDAATGSVKIIRNLGGKIRELKGRLDDPVQAGDTILARPKLF